MRRRRETEVAVEKGREKVKGRESERERGRQGKVDREREK